MSGVAPTNWKPFRHLNLKHKKTFSEKKITEHQIELHLTTKHVQGDWFSLALDKVRRDLKLPVIREVSQLHE
jgi:hypothetical protein